MKGSHRKRSIIMLAVSLALMSTCCNAEQQTDTLDEFALDSGRSTSSINVHSTLPIHAVSAVSRDSSMDATPPLEQSATSDSSTDKQAQTNVNIKDQTAQTTPLTTTAKTRKKTKKYHAVASIAQSSPQTTPTELKKDTSIVASKEAPSTPNPSESAAKTATEKAVPAPEDMEEVPDDSFLGAIARHLKFSASIEDKHSTPSRSSSSGSSDESVNVNSNPSAMQSMWQTVEQVAMGALGLLGVHYRFGGNTPEKGLDCSGFVRYVFNQSLGIKLPRTSHEISQVGVKVDENHLIPGDLVFFNTRNISFSHVGIYLGDNRFIHSPRTGKNVEIGRITDHYWSARFNGGRRILGQLASRSSQH